jgi:hypothetical protein
MPASAIMVAGKRGHARPWTARVRLVRSPSMRTAPEADDLDLPPLDGELGGLEEADPEGDEAADAEDAADLGAHHELGDALDDATGEADPLDEIAVEGAEGGWLLDAEGTEGLDVGTFDLSLSPEGKILDEDEREAAVPVDEELGANEEVAHTDGGEEGPVADDEELREEDLPALDADDDGDVADDSLFERGAMDTGEELRWDDRAWARAPVLADGGDIVDADDSGMLAVSPLDGLGEDAKHAARDATWKRLEETGKITAATLVPGESVVIALDGPERPVLVRILSDGVARIIAEIDTSTADDEVEACRVTGLRWDVGRGCLVATGTFGAQAFRPA